MFEIKLKAVGALITKWSSKFGTDYAWGRQDDVEQIEHLQSLELS